ncbi:MAG: DUF202 domain-containing protein [Candidatus Dojkabacteria bacterium]
MQENRHNTQKENNPINLAQLVSILANERTILAYIRTSLALLATGIAFQEFFHKPVVLIIGYGLLLLSVIIFLIGCISYIKNKKKIKNQNESVSAEYLD